MRYLRPFWEATVDWLIDQHTLLAAALGLGALLFFGNIGVSFRHPPDRRLQLLSLGNIAVSGGVAAISGAALLSAPPKIEPAQSVALAIPTPVVLERASLLPNAKEPPNYRLYVYLLIEPAADRAKRLSALRAYACFISPAATAPHGNDRGVFLVPVTAAAAKINQNDKDLLRQKLADPKSYDFDRAHALMLEFSRAAGQPVDPNGIFVVEAITPIGDHPTKGHAYNLSGLLEKDVGDWILAERSNIEQGWSAGTPDIERAHPGWAAVFAGIGSITNGIVPITKAVAAPKNCID